MILENISALISYYLLRPNTLLHQLSRGIKTLIVKTYKIDKLTFIFKVF